MTVWNSLLHEMDTVGGTLCDDRRLKQELVCVCH